MTMNSVHDASEYEIIGEATHQILELKDQEITCNLYGYRRNTARLLCYYLLSVVLCGLPQILTYFSSSFKGRKYERTSLKEADILMVEDNHGNYRFVRVEQIVTKLPNRSEVVNVRYFHYRHSRIIWLHNEQTFGFISALQPQLTLEEYVDNTAGLAPDDYDNLLKLYGPNKIEIDVKSYWSLFVDEVFNPFYLFQLFSIVLWSLDDYYIYAACIFLLTAISIIVTLRQTKKQSLAVHDLVESSKCDKVVVVDSEGKSRDVDPVDLVPGDVFVLPKNDFILPCDAILLNGQCIVNESMLTGESVPETKTAPSPVSEVYDFDAHKRHTLFSGTHMLQCRYYSDSQVLARVLRTGFATTKGALVKSILFPSPVGLKFYKDSLKFVLALFSIAACGMGYCMYLYIRRRATVEEIVLRSLDVVTIVVPPGLPAAMAIGILYSQKRLKRLGIFCISPPKINVCGKLKLACFDKTGTLTHEGLDVQSVIPANDKYNSFFNPITNCQELPMESRIVQAMATCHSLTQIDGKISGDPLDLSMFDFTNWKLEEPGEDETSRFDMLAPTIVRPETCQTSDSSTAEEFSYQLGIIRQFPFSSNLQSMSVIVRDLRCANMVTFTKGAPEKVANMCRPETLPRDFAIRLKQYTTEGYRVIALAYKELPRKFRWKEAQKAKREMVECDLNFLGFLIMQNTLKPETEPVINVLHAANIRTVMITGDNLLTAISVARDCAMVKSNEAIYIIETDQTQSALPKIALRNTETNNSSTSSTDTIINFDVSDCHFAVDGHTWSVLRSFYADLIPHLLVKTTIFARFHPDQKAQLVTQFQTIDYVVAMVGDGANDCGALKAANVGVSLSQAEASVAAPFTSSLQNISCLIHLMVEGRCALVTSFAVFKYMALYSLIQFTSVLILYREHSIFGDVQFLYIDLIVTTSLAVTIAKQGPAEKLCRKRPPGSLVSPKILVPLILQIFTCVLVQITSQLLLYQQDWFEPIPHTQGDDVTVECWENTALFIISSFQYIILACVYSKGLPFREPLIRNYMFLICAVGLATFQVWLLVSPSRLGAEFFEVVYLPKDAPRDQVHFKYKLLLLPAVHFLLANLIEGIISDSAVFRKMFHCLRMKKVPKNKYKMLLHQIDVNTLIPSA